MGIESGCVSARYPERVLLNLSRGRRGGICRDRILLGDGLGHGAGLGVGGRLAGISQSRINGSYLAD